ncbi:roadblock/LC7 domain-containing protein [Streptomyces sp. HD1123-B1]|uniref:roadblock/LC7 domain-containing protein n=1 Tax=Streptomyces TaxID=1883 RepID=UPI0020C87373|nr:roadblock/LC7 domain-containing protein [Streptomyces sp. NEAU-Y11]MCP9207241.1 roadblock/LC7 domain-containing protein [Streptomyces sp. NEAU-Y11]
MSDEGLDLELKSLRERVLGVSDTIVATADGLLVASDSYEIHAESLAALTAAMLGLARRTTGEVGIGGLREVVTRAQSGHLIVYAIGEQALLAVRGDEGLDLDGLRVTSRGTVERLAALMSVDLGD